MSRLMNFLKNRKYSSRMFFFMVIAVISVTVVQDRFDLAGRATETILTPEQYEEYSRIMLVPIFLIALVPITFGMWFKEEQLKRKGLLIPSDANFTIKDLQIENEPIVKEVKTNGKSDKETEFEFEYPN